MATSIITVVNQKGGVGKSTTALALASGLSLLKGYRVLSIDLDAQGNFTFSQGVTPGSPTVLGVLTGEVKAYTAIQSTKMGDIIPSSKALAGADAFITDTGKEYRLKEALEKGLPTPYDYIIIDTPPALGILTINALTASHSVIIPAQADIYSLQGVEQLAETIETVRKYCNRDLLIDGILLTRYSTRGILSREVATMAEQLATKMGTRLYKARIREAIVIKEAQLSQQSIFKYAPGSKVAGDYKAFIYEFLNRGE